MNGYVAERPKASARPKFSPRIFFQSSQRLVQPASAMRLTVFLVKVEDWQRKRQAANPYC
jgi:hypothetical protein